MDDSQKRILIVVVIAAIMIGCGLTASRFRPGTQSVSERDTFDQLSSSTAEGEGEGSLWPTLTPTGEAPGFIQAKPLSSIERQVSPEVVENNAPDCPGAPDPRLSIGGMAEVSRIPPYSNRVRTDASFDAIVLGLISPGEDIDVLTGPVCSSGRFWWKVRSTASGLTGWTVEGDQDNYWLIPFEDG